MAHRSILLAAAVALSLTGLCGRPAHADTPEAVEVRSEQSTVRVVAFFFDAAGKRLAGSTGTGIVVGPGQVITNRHVLGHPGARSIALYVVPDRRSGTHRLAAEIVDESTDFDLALFTVTDLKAPPITMASETDIKGSPVNALGYPGKIDDLIDATDDALRTPTEPYLTEGNVALLTNATVIGGSRIPVIFHTAAINAGDSGGPLIDQCGRLVGVNTSGAATTIGDDGIETANGQFIASGVENLVAFLKRNGRVPTVDPRHCDHGRVVAARREAPPASGAKPAILDDLRSGLTVTETSGAGVVRLARVYVIQISGTVLAFVLIYVLFLRTRIRRWTAPSCPVPVTCDVPEKPV